MLDTNVRSRLRKKVELMAQKNVLQVKCWCQKETPSSRTNMTPPKGAPNAAETPAAAPQATKSRLALSFLNGENTKVLYRFDKREVAFDQEKKERHSVSA